MGFQTPEDMVFPAFIMHHHPKPRPVRGTDDYLTARGANPRTGLISPSIYTPGTSWDAGCGGLDGAGGGSANRASGLRTTTPLAEGDESGLRLRKRVRLRVGGEMRRGDELAGGKDEFMGCEHEVAPGLGDGVTCRRGGRDATAIGLRSPRDMAQKPDEVLLSFNVPSPVRAPVPVPLPDTLDGVHDDGRLETLGLDGNHDSIKRRNRKTDTEFHMGESQARNFSLPVLTTPLHLDAVHDRNVPNTGHQIKRKPVSWPTNALAVEDLVNEPWPGFCRRSSVMVKNLFDRLPRLDIRHPSDAAQPRAERAAVPSRTTTSRNANSSSLHSRRDSSPRRTRRMRANTPGALQSGAWFFLLRQVEHIPLIQEILRPWRTFFNETLPAEERLAALSALSRQVWCMFICCTIVVCSWGVVVTLKSFFDVVLQPVWTVVGVFT